MSPEIGFDSSPLVQMLAEQQVPAEKIRGYVLRLNDLILKQTVLTLVESRGDDPKAADLSDSEGMERYLASFPPEQYQAALVQATEFYVTSFLEGVLKINTPEVQAQMLERLDSGLSS